MADWFDQQGIDFGGAGYARGDFIPNSARGQEFAFNAPGSDTPPGYNPEGAAYDPFAYTKGSLLTPWEGRFQYTGGDGGSGVAEFKPFSYGNFDYRAANPGQFSEVYANPGNFVYGDYQSGPEFKAPTAEDMKADPGYEGRLKAGQRALQASKAMQGVLRTGGTAKGLMKYGQEFASNEYGNVYNRRASEFDRSQAERRFAYGANRANAAENFDRNVSNARQGYQIRQGAWRDNAQVALDASRHGFDVAQGVYDRNLALARQGYEDERAHANAVASAGAAAANRDYNRQLAEYQMARDEFWTNQDRQYNILDREATRGYNAALNYAGMQGDIYMNRGNAAASGVMGAANARAAGASSIGNTIGDLALYAGTMSSGTPRPPQQSYYPPPGYWGL